MGSFPLPVKKLVLSNSWSILEYVQSKGTFWRKINCKTGWDCYLGWQGKAHRDHRESWQRARKEGGWFTEMYRPTPGTELGVCEAQDVFEFWAKSWTCGVLLLSLVFFLERGGAPGCCRGNKLLQILWMWRRQGRLSRDSYFLYVPGESFLCNRTDGRTWTCL